MKNLKYIEVACRLFGKSIHEINEVIVIYLSNARSCGYVVSFDRKAQEIVCTPVYFNEYGEVEDTPKEKWKRFDVNYEYWKYLLFKKYTLSIYPHIIKHDPYAIK